MRVSKSASDVTAEATRIEDALIMRPRFMKQALARASADSSVRVYSSAIFPGLYGKGLFSPDMTLGLETDRDFAVRLYRIEPLRKLMTFWGHTCDVNSTAISRDNKYLATGAFDNTVRLWSISNGTSLAVFHLYGNVNTVAMTPGNDYIVATYYSAPQRTRGAILKVINLH